MKILLLNLFILIQCQLFAQENFDTLSTEESVFYSCYIGPEFPGGSQALKDYFTKNTVAPAVSDKLFPVKCYTRFIVAANGNICNVEVVKSVPHCPECEQEAIRLIKNMPEWVPEKIQGKPVNTIMHLPVIFVFK